MSISLFNTRRTGAAHETRALKFLRKQGYVCIARNFSSRYGEIDLVVSRENEVLVFVEVRYRKNRDFGYPEETVTPLKQDRLRKTASFFLSRRQELAALPCRFDVIAISRETGRDHIEWIKNAFD